MLQSATPTGKPAARRRTSRLLGLMLILITLALALPAGASAFLPPGAGWAWLDPGTPADLYAVAFSDATHGWAVGNGGVILATTNGGATWSKQNSGTTESLSAVACADASHGWAVGGKYVPATASSTSFILATANGGVTWSTQSSGITTDLKGVAFADATHGWAVGTGGVILATTNGGATWSKQNSGTTADLTGVTFPDVTHGWAVSGTWVEDQGYTGTILATTNGGATWSTQVSGVSSDFTGVAFPDTIHGWAVTFDGAVYATTNGGANWSVKRLGSGSVHPSAVAFPDAIHGWAVGGTEDEPWGALIWATTNGGATWKVQQRGGGPEEGVSAVAFPDATHGWVVGNLGTILATSTGGKPPVTLKLSGLRSGAMKLGRRVTARGTVTPTSLAGSKVTLKVQKKKGAKWLTVKRVKRTISASGAYIWKYMPARGGAYHMRASIARTTTTAAARTTWRPFKVKQPSRREVEHAGEDSRRQQAGGGPRIEEST